ncbi:uncharacterized protein LOC100890604 [Strongylocentrotus purpuratus]|uniref:Uncharacterized protein n=1 Tax=Strongylocentrotus purpuratus TaxID=7668 RepID=A0A7M7NE22_STRPU|nr:uncharacterized protein LOC100890604 [Strongylocentrotus purpuratus]
MTEKLWYCLRSCNSLKQLSISDSSLSFPPSPPELLSVTKLSAERVTSQSYKGVLSSVPCVTDIDVSIDDAETSNTSQMTTATRPMGQTRAENEQCFVHIRLHPWPARTTDRKIDSGEAGGGLILLFEDQTRTQQLLYMSGVKGRDEEALVNLFVMTKQLTYLNSGNAGGSLNNDGYAIQNTRLEIQQCQLSTEMTKRLWSSLTSFTSLNHLTISDSSLRFPSYPPELPFVTKLSAKRVMSRNYEDLLSLLPDLVDIDITIDDAERDIPQITACLRRTRRQQLIHVTITAYSALPSEKNNVSRETMRALGLLIRERTKNLQRLCLSRVKCTDEEDLVELVESCRHVKTLSLIMLLDCGTNRGGKLSLHITGLRNSKKSKKSLRVIVVHDDGKLSVEKYQLSSEMTERMWSGLRSFTLLNHLTISDSSLSFPSSPPELPFVRKLSSERVMSQSYEGLLSSLPGLRDIDITINDAERDIPQITAGLRRTGGHELTHISLKAPPSLPSEKNSVSRETVRGLGLLIREQTENLQQINVSGVKCTDEEDMVYLIESCMHAKTMSRVWFVGCGTTEGGRLEYYLTSLDTSPGPLAVFVQHGIDDMHAEGYRITHTA